MIINNHCYQIGEVVLSKLTLLVAEPRMIHDKKQFGTMCRQSVQIPQDDFSKTMTMKLSVNISTRQKRTNFNPIVRKL